MGVSGMKIAGVIAEYNPFHTGHAAHLEAARRQGASHLVVVLSANLVQRGEPAAFSKAARAQMALQGGADLVLELPSPYAMAPAERFAFGGVRLLESLGCVEAISFGCEAGAAEPLRRAAALEREEAFRQARAGYLRQGITFAAAGQRAAQDCAPELAELFAGPNNVLAMEYLRQLEALGHPMQPLAVPRLGAGHDGAPAGGYASASYLRRHPEMWGQYLPPAVLDTARREQAAGRAVASAEENGRGILALVRRLGPEERGRLPDLSEGLEHRLAKAAAQARSLEELYALIKTRRYPMARMRRLVMAAAVGLPAGLAREAPPYARVLAHNQRGRQILAQMKRSCSIPFSESLRRLEDCGGRAAEFARLESRVTDFWGLCCPQVQPCGEDYRFSAWRE